MNLYLEPQDLWNVVKDCVNPLEDETQMSQTNQNLLKSTRQMRLNVSSRKYFFIRRDSKLPLGLRTGLSQN